METELMSLSELDAKKDTASCNICYARNYEATQPAALGEKVDHLYKLNLGRTAVILCDKCVDQLSALLDTFYRLRDHKLRAGDEVFVLERDEVGLACGVAGYMFLAEAGGRAIVTPYINDMEDLDGIMEYHVEETVENYDTALAVFPMEDCFADRERAHTALRAEKGEDEEWPAMT